MQIACKRYSCQKAVEVCYWSCKFRRNCKDWQNALAGDPGLVAIQSRLEAAAAKSGRAFDPQTLVIPARQAKQRPLASPNAAATKVSVVSRPALSVQSTLGTRSDVAMLSRAQLAASSTTEANAKANKANKVKGKKKMARSIAESSNGTSESAVEALSEKSAAAKAKKAKPKAPRAKQATNGTVYLMLSKNGKYRELRESDLLNQASTLLKDPSLRLVKGQLLIPTISFLPAEE